MNGGTTSSVWVPYPAGALPQWSPPGKRREHAPLPVVPLPVKCWPQWSPPVNGGSTARYFRAI